MYKRTFSKPRTRLERIHALIRKEYNLFYILTKKPSTNIELFETLTQFEAVQKEIQIQKAYELKEVQNEKL